MSRVPAARLPPRTASRGTASRAAPMMKPLSSFSSRGGTATRSSSPRRIIQCTSLPSISASGRRARSVHRWLSAFVRCCSSVPRVHPAPPLRRLIRASLICPPSSPPTGTTRQRWSGSPQGRSMLDRSAATSGKRSCTSSGAATVRSHRQSRWSEARGRTASRIC